MIFAILDELSVQTRDFVEIYSGAGQASAALRQEHLCFIFPIHDASMVR